MVTRLAHKYARVPAASITSVTQPRQDPPQLANESASGVPKKLILFFTIPIIVLLLLGAAAFRITTQIQHADGTQRVIDVLSPDDWTPEMALAMFQSFVSQQCSKPDEFQRVRIAALYFFRSSIIAEFGTEEASPELIESLVTQAMSSYEQVCCSHVLMHLSRRQRFRWLTMAVGISGRH